MTKIHMIPIDATDAELETLVDLLLMDSDVQKQLLVKGGQGSGNFGHAGRPGEVGGSADGEGIPGTFVGRDYGEIKKIVSRFSPDQASEVLKKEQGNEDKVK